MVKRFAAMTILVLIFSIRGGAQPVDVTVWASWAGFDSQDIDEIEFDAELNFDDGTGFGASANWFWSERFSTEVFTMAMDTDAVFRVGFEDFPAEDIHIGSIDVTPVMLTAQYHFHPHGRVSPRLGAGVAYVLVGDIDPVVTEDVEVERIHIDDELTFVLNAGLGIALGPRLGVDFDARYLPLKPAARAEGDPEALDLEMNPLILSVGLRYRFGH